MERDIVAISSLESPDHAMKKDPGIISVVWTLGRRCNYDCSYCSPYIHDNFSPHIKLEHAAQFLKSLENNTLAQGKKVKIGITGGEPFVHPQFLKILEEANQLKNITQLSVTSNGSLPLEMYNESSKYITNLAISLHLEQGDAVIDKTVEKMLQLNQIKTWFFTVNLMALPGKFDKVKSIINIFKENGVKFIVRKIDPPIEYERKVAKKDAKADPNFVENKKTYKTILNNTLDINWESYYSADELEFLNSLAPTSWQNMRTYAEDGSYIETNSDNIKIKSQNQFKGWHCFIGVDTIYVQDDGSIFRGYCMAGNKIGHISENIVWPNSPIICPLKYCECVADIVTRKAKEIKHLPLIS